MLLTAPPVGGDGGGAADDGPFYTDPWTEGEVYGPQVPILPPGSTGPIYGPFRPPETGGGWTDFPFNPNPDWGDGLADGWGGTFGGGGGIKLEPIEPYSPPLGPTGPDTGTQFDDGGIPR